MLKFTIRGCVHDSGMLAAAGETDKAPLDAPLRTPTNGSG
jgi:hypothetical protein